MDNSLKSQINDVIEQAISLCDTEQIRNRFERQSDVMLVSGHSAGNALAFFRNACERMRFALRNGTFDVMPIGIPQELHSHIQQHCNVLSGLQHDNNSIKTFGQALKNFHEFLWSKRLSSFLDTDSAKLSYEARLEDLVGRLEGLAERERETQSALRQIDENSKKSSVILTALEVHENEAEKHLAKIQDDVNAAAAGRNETDTYQKESKGYSATASQVVVEINAHKTKVDQFVQKLQEYENRLNVIATDASESSKKNTKETEAIIAENKSLSLEIKEILQKALGASLFHAFDERRVVINKGKWLWCAILGAAMLVTVLLLWWLGSHFEDLFKGLPAGAPNVPGHESPISMPSVVVFVIRLLITTLAIWAMFFASKQYSKERELEEQYAFKAAKALSLEPYRRLIGELVSSKRNPAEKEFVEQALNGIFEDLASLRPDIVKEKVIRQELKGFTECAKEMSEAISPILHAHNGFKDSRKDA